MEQGPNVAAPSTAGPGPSTPTSSTPGSAQRREPAERLVSQPRTAVARSRSLLSSIMCRQIAPHRVSPRPILEELACNEDVSAHMCWNGHAHVPPFMLRFCPDGGREHWVAVADEEGVVSLLDTSRPAHAQTGAQRTQWRAHYNAIFDLAWSRGVGRMVTASGDQTCRLWDTSTHLEIQTLRGHTGSVKAVSTRPDNPHVFASASRDGRVMLWDTRGGSHPTCVLHNVHEATSDLGGAKRKRGWRGLPVLPQSVSSVAYLHDAAHTLATSGASDGAVKLWDSRFVASRQGKRRSEPAPLHTLTPRRTGLGRRHGIVCLSVDASGKRMLAGSADNTIYVYDTVRPSEGEVAQLRHGPRIDSFYIRAAFSPDGRFVISGSSDENVYLFDVDRPNQPGLALRGHRGEVTGVDWCPNDLCRIASCSDDATVRVWDVARGSSESARRATAEAPHAAVTPQTTGARVSADLAAPLRNADLRQYFTAAAAPPSSSSSSST